MGDEVRALDVTWEERPYERGEVAGYRLAVACTDDPAANQAVFDDGEAAGVWVNAADDPERCSYTLPARLDRGRVLVTVSTGGHSPALASWLRDQLAEQVGDEVDTLAGLLAEARAELLADGPLEPRAPIGERPSIRGCWTSSGPVASTRPGSSSEPPSTPPIRPSRARNRRETTACPSSSSG